MIRLGLIIASLILMQQFVSSRRAPLYWSAYEFLYEKSKANQATYIPQNIWQDNINWVISNLKVYGYRIICIDGWGDDFASNQNGYRIKHSLKWTHDYQWWSKTLQAQGMTLGIYNNPLWVNMQAVNAGKLIKGTKIPLQNIVNRDEKAMFFNWVQIEKEGARQYIKGYVQYYADMGVKFLRADFLSWYQDGKDINPDLSRPIQRPRLYYQLALQWMREACEANQITLSLVMPHLYNYGLDELTYAGGSMIRINADVCDGGWQRFNNVNRGIQHSIWSTFDNTFDGFIYWSNLSGFGKQNLILDGDFTRINTFLDNNEKQTIISLQVIAGGPLAVTDQFNTIGNNINYYQNTEILQLNQGQFVGKPLSANPKDSKSQIWKGKINQQQWVIGLFNREDHEQLRTFDFSKELGIAQGHARDLWRHKDLGLKSGFSEMISRHGCKIYRVSRHTYQAESPLFTPSGGNFAKEVLISLSSSTQGSKIYYTMNGEQPTVQSILYNAPILLQKDAQVRAMTVKEGIAYSFIVGNIYSVNQRQINNKLFVGGNFSNWQLSSMSYLGNYDWRSSFIYLAPKQYEFKIANSFDWSGDDWGDANGTSGVLKLTTLKPNKNALFRILQGAKYAFHYNEETFEYSIRRQELLS